MKTNQRQGNMMTDASDEPDARVTAAVDAAASSRNQAFSQQLVMGLGSIASVLMASPQHRYSFLADLEWPGALARQTDTVLPALATGQFSLADARDQTTGFSAPVGAVLWAMVSEEVDQRLTAQPGYPIRLRPQDWRSGNIPWLVEAIGEPRAVAAMVKTLIERQFPEVGLKAVVRGDDGKARVELLKPSAGPQLDVVQ
jgi:cytolysin-activating lysine-acyltransferase